MSYRCEPEPDWHSLDSVAVYFALCTTVIDFYLRSSNQDVNEVQTLSFNSRPLRKVLHYLFKNYTHFIHNPQFLRVMVIHTVVGDHTTTKMFVPFGVARMSRY